jgi:putative ABC transport system permease protein
MLGGVIGLILIFAGTLIFSYAAEMTISLSMANIILGLSISGVIGVLAGFIPALSASRLDPVEAMNAV